MNPQMICTDIKAGKASFQSQAVWAPPLTTRMIFNKVHNSWSFHFFNRIITQIDPFFRKFEGIKLGHVGKALSTRLMPIKHLVNN